MSTANDSTRRMSTRSGNKDKMAKIVRCYISGNIVDEDSNLEGTPGEDTAMTLENNEGEKEEDTQPTKRKKANATKAAKKKPSNTIRTVATKKTRTSKEDDAAAKREVVSKLGKLEDKYWKKAKDAHSLHPCYRTGEVPGSNVL